MTTQDRFNAGQIKLALTREEAASALGISAVTLDRLTRRRLLLPCRATRRPLFSLQELHRFLGESQAEAPRLGADMVSLQASALAATSGEETRTTNEANAHGMKPWGICSTPSNNPTGDAPCPARGV